MPSICSSLIPAPPSSFMKITAITGQNAMKKKVLYLSKKKNHFCLTPASGFDGNTNSSSASTTDNTTNNNYNVGSYSVFIFSRNISHSDD
ncbi:unnamed protein product [Rhizopus stolonifer]